MRFYNIFFSPTGGTEKVADIVAKGTKLDAEEIDLIKEPDKNYWIWQHIHQSHFANILSA